MLVLKSGFIYIAPEVERRRPVIDLPTGAPVGVVDLAAIPHGLDAEELERFLRERGAETRCLNGAQNQEGNDEAGN